MIGMIDIISAACQKNSKTDLAGTDNSPLT